MRKVVMIAVAGALLAGCGDDDEAVPTAKAAARGYTPVSDVTAHAAVGADMKAIRAALEARRFEDAGRIWSEGRNSKKDDGSMRTLAGFVEEAPVGERVQDALTGRGAARRLDEEQRAEWVDKGMVAALELKVLDELDSAIEKAKAGDADPKEGAPHNVDEAWAFFTAQGEGLAATAGKRAADFGLEGKVAEPVVAALRDAQKAAKAGDAFALQKAREAARGAMNRIFALAVVKYAAKAIEDEVARAEGAAFAWGLDGDLPAAELRAVNAAFGAKAGYRSALKARETINGSLDELGLDAPVPAFRG